MSVVDEIGITKYIGGFKMRTTRRPRVSKPMLNVADVRNDYQEVIIPAFGFSDSRETLRLRNYFTRSDRELARRVRLGRKKNYVINPFAYNCSDYPLSLTTLMTGSEDELEGNFWLNSDYHRYVQETRYNVAMMIQGRRVFRPWQSSQDFSNLPAWKRNVVATYGYSLIDCYSLWLKDDLTPFPGVEVPPGRSGVGIFYSVAKDHDQRAQLILPMKGIVVVLRFHIVDSNPRLGDKLIYKVQRFRLEISEEGNVDRFFPGAEQKLFPHLVEVQNQYWNNCKSLSSDYEEQVSFYTVFYREIGDKEEVKKYKAHLRGKDKEGMYGSVTRPWHLYILIENLLGDIKASASDDPYKFSDRAMQIASEVEKHSRIPAYDWFYKLESIIEERF